MVGFIFLLLLVTLLIIGLIYGISIGLTIIIMKVSRQKKPNFFVNKQYKKIIFLFSICMSIGIVILYISINNAHNYKTAYIENGSGKFTITLIGKRSEMVHDLVSVFKNKTYIDSIQFQISKDYGIVNYNELPNKPGFYKWSKGAITIDKKRMKIDLYYYNEDERVTEPFEWNGDYKLELRGDGVSK